MVPLVVLAFLTDPEVVGKILRHLGVATEAPVRARARSRAEPLGLDVEEACGWGGVGSEGAGAMGGGGGGRASIRPPPG
jgi:hypothetical protein